ncbi:unnamed protein product [Blepharisma stoltei]|uniref:Kinetochore protein SPC25 n=1 Tax=Blepharisma stoltei TaxID=1481888 RepID=A0AAU9J4N6_9CILI|nr:unnamed protein product [Blepharisma stoltei]
METVSGASQRLRESILPEVETVLQIYRESVLLYNENRLAAYEADIDSLTNQLERLKANIEGEEAAISFLKGQIKDMEKEFPVNSTDSSGQENKAQTKNNLRQKIKEAEHITKELGKALNYYQFRFGLSLKRLPNSSLRISYEFIKRELDEVEHSVTLHISDSTNAYEIVKCTPNLPQIYPLLHNLNQTNDFARFVKDVRKSFISLYL